MPNSMSTKSGFYEESPTTDITGNTNNENLNTDNSNYTKDDTNDKTSNAKTKSKDNKNAIGR